MINANTPIAPIFDKWGDIKNIKNNSGYTTNEKYTGLTKREHFAGLAMQAILGNPDYIWEAESTATSSVEFADALLKELSK